MKLPREILVVHHSHTDWGYTTHQSVIEELHLGFIDEAVKLCERNEDREDGLKYRWTCESAWVAHAYLKKRDRRQKRAFLRRVERGEIEVCGLPLHPTPLADARTIAAALEVLDEIRQEGVPVSVALGCDINGLSWPWSDALLDAGIVGLGMAMNFTCGGGLKRWTAFRWKSPRGRLLLCWQGTHYNQGSYWGLNHEAYSVASVAPLRIKELRHFPYRKVLLQVTNIPPDNMGPHPRYLEYLAIYNRLAAQNGWPRMRTATMREWFDYLRHDEKNTPIHEGDWTDWWASGIGSTPRETAALMGAQRRIRTAERQGLASHISTEVRKKIFLGAEHTWGASSSSKPFLPSSIAGLSAKQNLIYEAVYAANGALRKSMPSGTAMYDPTLEGFDPSWLTTVSRAAGSDEKKPPAGKSSHADVVEWDRLIARDGPKIIIEEPADGKRSTWFEVGKFNKPRAHGRWPKAPRWRRSILRGGTVIKAKEDSVLNFDVHATLDFTEKPRALYIVFPLGLPEADILADVGGAWADLRKQYVPGSCINWYTIHQGVLISGRKESLLWTSWDAPLVMFDSPCAGPPKKKNAFRPLVLVSWVLNTYWFTNFQNLSGGDYRFRYRLKYWPYRVSVAEAQKFCDDQPEIDQPKIAGKSSI